MLSTQCDLKLQSMILSQSGSQLEDIQETLSQVRDLCELSDDDEETEVLTKDQFIDKVTKCVKDLNIKISPAKIIKVCLSHIHLSFTNLLLIFYNLKKF